MWNPFQDYRDYTQAFRDLRVAVDKLTFAINRQERVMHIEFQALKDALAAHDTVEAGVVALLKDLHDRLVAMAEAPKPEEVQALADAVAAHTQALADAVVANTVAAPTP